MKEALRKIFLFDISLIDDLQSIRRRIIGDNRRFATIWALVEFFFAGFCLFMSFHEWRFTLCRDAYIFTMAVSVLALLCSELLAREKPLAVYLAMLLVYVALFGAGILIAHSLYQNDILGTTMIFASALIAPVLFVSNTLWNIMIAVLDIVSAALIMRGLPAGIYRSCITDVSIFSAMGVIIGHFLNGARYERYVFAESAVKLAELQKRYAYYDQMTGLLNRRAYSEKIRGELPADCCAVMVDVNGLKKTNDTLGHAAGDEIITGCAECLRRSFEDIGTVYRLGGDEFCVLVKGSGEDVQSRLAQLKTACAEWKGQYAGGISISYGFATAEEFSDFTALLKAADDRMYESKKEYYGTE